MIQRKQTLLLFLLGFLNIGFLFIPGQNVIFNGNLVPVMLTPLRVEGLPSNTGHMAAIYLNFTMLVITFTTVFLYNRRQLQLKLCYALALLWLMLTAMIAFCPFVSKTETVSAINMSFFAIIPGLIAAIISIMAARLVKKDIDLLKSADRIR